MNVVLNLVFIAFISVQHGAVRVGPPLEKPSDSCGQAEEQQLDGLLADLLEEPGDQLVVSEGAIHSVKVASQGTLDGHFSANPSAQSSAAAELPQWMMNDLSDMAVIRSPHDSDYLPTEAWGSPQPLQDDEIPVPDPPPPMRHLALAACNDANAFAVPAATSQNEGPAFWALASALASPAVTPNMEGATSKASAPVPPTRPTRPGNYLGPAPGPAPGSYLAQLCPRLKRVRHKRKLDATGQDVLEDQSEVAAAADHAMEDCRPALAEAEPVTPSPSKRRISKKTVQHLF